MEPQGVDVPALLRRTFPLWLVWILYAAPALWAVQVFRAVTAVPNLPFNDTTIYDENGTVISTGPGAAESVGWLARFGVALALSFGTPPPAPKELSLLGLVAAAVVTAMWAGRRSFHLRSVAAVGAVFSFALGVVGLLVVTSRDASYEVVKQMWGPEGIGLFDGQFASWGLVGIFGAILTWTFARLGWGPVPMRPLPDSQVRPEPQANDGAAPAPDDGGAPEPAAGGWDVRPELPPDFVAPEPGSSLFERPTSRTSWADVGAGGPTDAAIAEDPLAVYRRPSGPDS